MSDQRGRRLGDEPVPQAGAPVQADARGSRETAEPDVAAAVDRRMEDPELSALLQHIRSEDEELLRRLAT